MAVSSTLMQAILAMDAYNQGYNSGLDHGQEQVGLATVSTDSTDEFSDPNAPPGTVSPDQAAGFYAVAYNYNGSTVISYRGTEQTSPTQHHIPIHSLQHSPRSCISAVAL